MPSRDPYSGSCESGNYDERGNVALRPFVRHKFRASADFAGIFESSFGNTFVLPQQRPQGVIEIFIEQHLHS